MPNMRHRPWAVVDAFTNRPFAGNPAAVLLFDGDDAMDDDLLQAVAAEANLSETAFLRPVGDGVWDLRWFTPTNEVELCGHATLASAHWLLARHDERGGVRFRTQSGELAATRTDDGRTRIDLPSLPAIPIDDPTLRESITRALGMRPTAWLRTQHDQVPHRNVMAVLDNATAVRDLDPDLAAIAKLPVGGVIVTAAGDEDGIDAVSRYFTPQHGIPEDPVTGSAHCTIGPWWSAELGRATIEAHQASLRGGHLTVTHDGDRVFLTGSAVTVVEGHLALP